IAAHIDHLHAGVAQETTDRDGADLVLVYAEKTDDYLWSMSHICPAILHVRSPGAARHADRRARHRQDAWRQPVRPWSRRHENHRAWQRRGSRHASWPAHKRDVAHGAPDLGYARRGSDESFQSAPSMAQSCAP